MATLGGRTLHILRGVGGSGGMEGNSDSKAGDAEEDEWREE